MARVQVLLMVLVALVSVAFGHFGKEIFPTESYEDPTHPVKPEYPERTHPGDTTVVMTEKPPRRTKPTEPKYPVEPTEPKYPVEPTEPKYPVEPTHPVEPTEPTYPTEPTHPIDTTEPPVLCVRPHDECKTDKDCCDRNLCTAAPWIARKTTICLPAPPKCYGYERRCAGAPGKPYVPYAPCCNRNYTCMEAPKLGWGSFCVRKRDYFPEPEHEKLEKPEPTWEPRHEEEKLEKEY